MAEGSTCERRPIVYIVQSDLCGVVKIGMTEHANARLRALRGLCSGAMSVLYLFPMSNKRAALDWEEWLHRVFRRHRNETSGALVFLSRTECFDGGPVIHFLNTLCHMSPLDYAAGCPMLISKILDGRERGSW